MTSSVTTTDDDPKRCPKCHTGWLYREVDDEEGTYLKCANCGWRGVKYRPLPEKGRRNRGGSHGK